MPAGAALALLATLTVATGGMQDAQHVWHAVHAPVIESGRVPGVPKAPEAFVAGAVGRTRQPGRLYVMSQWIPKPNPGVDLMRLNLDGEEGFVLSRIDGYTTVQSLRHLTGLPESRIEHILGRLVQSGAVHAPAAGWRAPAAAADAAIGEEPTTLDDQPPIHEATDPDETPSFVDDEVFDPAALLQDPDLFSDEDGSDGAPLLNAGELDTEEPAGAKPAEASGVDDERAALTYRQRYEAELHPLPRDQRIKLARAAEGDELCALCFDPDPGVIRALLENLKAGLVHARLIATHHRNPVGLDALAHRAAFARDGHVQRLLLRNPQSSDAVLQRLLQNKPLAPLYTLTKSRELTERAKRNVRRAFRRSFQQANPEERVGLVFSTEGRCLNALIGLTLDAKTTSLLCARAYVSTLLIQNFARWPATPPLLLQHLFKQQAVRRAPHLKQALLQHPNCPSQVKRQNP